jgi:hypothetical protein
MGALLAPGRNAAGSLPTFCVAIFFQRSFISTQVSVRNPIMSSQTQPYCYCRTAPAAPLQTLPPPMWREDGPPPSLPKPANPHVPLALSLQLRHYGNCSPQPHPSHFHYFTPSIICITLHLSPHHSGLCGLIIHRRRLLAPPYFDSISLWGLSLPSPYLILPMTSLTRQEYLFYFYTQIYQPPAHFANHLFFFPSPSSHK